MKKLMTMLGAAATAFGLYAADPIFSSSFESAETIPVAGGTAGGWTCADEDAKFEKKDYTTEPSDAYVYTTSEPVNERYPAFVDGGQASYLKMKTTFGKPIVQEFAGVVGEDGLYIDQLVKFTVFDDDPVDLTDAKIGVYIKDLTGGDGDPDNHLFVAAGQYVNGELKQAFYDCGKIDNVDAWKRISLKAIKAYNTNFIGFQLYVDSVPVDYEKIGTDENALAYDTTAQAYLTPSAKAFNAVKKIFPAIAAAESLSAIAYDGQGEIDDVMVSTDAPGPWAEKATTTLTWDEPVTGLSYTIGSVTTTLTEDEVAARSATIDYIPGSEMAITINPTYTDANWQFKELTTESVAVEIEGNVATVKAKDQAIAVVSKDVTPRVSVKIGDADPTTYPTIADAIAEVNKLSAGQSAEIVLNQDLDVGGSATKGTDFGITTTADITLDLNGNELRGTVEGTFNSYVIMCSGNLTIIDSGDPADGKIIPGSGYKGAVKVVGTGALTVTGGTFDGEVAATTSEISGGKFLRTANAQPGTEGALTLADGYKVDASEGDYWEVVPMDKFTVTVEGAANATVTINGEETSTLELNEGEDYEVVVTPNAYYEYAEGSYGDGFVWTEGTLVATGTADAAVPLTAADATAIEYTLTYSDGAEENPFEKTQKFTAANYADLVLWDGERDDYTRVDDGWVDADGNPVDIKQTIAGLIAKQAETLDLTVYGEWEAEATEYTVTLSYEATQIDPDTVVALVNGEPATIDANAFTAAEGAKIVITATAQEDYENVTFTVGEGTPAATCEFTLEADTEVTIAATKKADPVLPDQPIEVPPEYETPDEYAAAINDGTVPKADLLKAPYGETTSDYLGLFEAVADGDKVKMELTEAAKTQLEEIAEAAAETALAVDAGTVSITEPIAGLYYSLNAGTTLEGMKTLSDNANKTSDGKTAIKFTDAIDKTQAAGFWKVLVTPTAVTPDVE